MNFKNRKYVVFTGGVISGLGKGVSAASVGLFFSDDLIVSAIKLDGYLNSDPGTMNPIEHGEVFVLEDGTEVDMDFGHYERFLGTNCIGKQNLTMGKVFDQIRLRERDGFYLGKTVQFIPHVTDFIQEHILQTFEDSSADLGLIEIGGTIGDIENELYVEALRQFEMKVGKENILYIHLTYVPIPYGVKEQKSKPTQQSINLLHNRGIRPDIIIARCEEMLSDSVKEKIALFSGISKKDVFTSIDVDSIYKLPKVFDDQGLCERVTDKFNLKNVSKIKFNEWNKLLTKNFQQEISIAIAGKYVGLEDSYASIIESLKHCEYFFGIKINVLWIDTEKIDFKILEIADGVIVPGGFGSRGVEGKIEVINYVRENKIPYLGICYGLQLAVVEFARNCCNIKNASSIEFDENSQDPVITLLDEQKNVVKKGGTMRLGSYRAKLSEGLVKNYYEKLNLIDDGVVSERHRHRFEVNPDYIEKIEEKGMIISGKSFERDLVEFIELSSDIHPYFVATQAHPELKSRLEKPAPLFYGLVENALKKSKK